MASTNSTRLLLLGAKNNFYVRLLARWPWPSLSSHAKLRRLPAAPSLGRRPLRNPDPTHFGGQQARAPPAHCLQTQRRHQTRVERKTDTSRRREAKYGSPSETAIIRYAATTPESTNTWRGEIGDSMVKGHHGHRRRSPDAAAASAPSPSTKPPPAKPPAAQGRGR